MKVIIDKAERLWKMPQPSLGPMKFTQRRLAARNVEPINLESYFPEWPDIKSLNGARTQLASEIRFIAAGDTLISELKSKILSGHSALKTVGLDPDEEIAIVPGIRMAGSFAALSLLNAGETASYPDPGPQYFRSAICLADGNPRRYLLSESNEYIFNPAALTGTSLKKTRMIFINYPHNPTGATVDYYFYSELLKHFQYSNILIVADCAHVHPGDPDIAIPLQVKQAHRKALELHSFSTTLGIPGLGFIAGHAAVIKVIKGLLATVGYAPDANRVRLAITGLDHADEVYAWRMQQLHNRRELLMDGLRKLGWSVRGGKLMPFLWARVPDHSTSVAFARRLFAKAGVRVAPGSDFGENGERWLRLSLCCDEKTAGEALERLSLHSKIWQRKYRPGV